MSNDEPSRVRAERILGIRGSEAASAWAKMLGLPDEQKVSASTFDERMLLERHELELEKVEKVLEEWAEQQNADRKLRKLFGCWLLGTLIAQLIVFSLVFMLDAFGTIRVDAAKLPIWLGALLIELIGLITVIAKGLFANTVPAFMQMIAKVLGKENE